MHPVGQAIYIFYMHQIFVLFATCIKMANLIFVPLVMADIVILFVSLLRQQIVLLWFSFIQSLGDICKIELNSIN
jgi:predicted membrane metal-binding protein